MERYVTLFDNLFLPQGLALYDSLERHGGDFVLWVLCVDKAACDILQKLKLPRLKTAHLADFETPALLSAKAQRTRGEYCWTITPLAPKVVFELDQDAERVTYVDADLYFLRDPQNIFTEFEISGKHVLITEHAYASEHDQSASSGKYCVQFMTFYRDKSEPVRKWWEERCLEWCFARIEDGKFGDQKYLDDWPVRFSNQVHVTTCLSAFLAPWNATRFPYSEGIIYHFHGFRITNRSFILTTGYTLPDTLIKHVYEPYMDSVRKALKSLESVGWNAPSQSPGYSPLMRIKNFIGAIKREFWRFRTARVLAR